MKSVFKRLLLLGLSLSVVVLAATQDWEKKESAPDTEDGGDPESSHAPQPEQASAQSAPHSPIPFKPLAGTTVTFSGTLVRAGAQLALRETAGVLYTLHSAGPAWPFEGADVRITGQLDTTTRLLHVDEIRSMIA